MNKFAALVVAATACVAMPLAAQSQGARVGTTGGAASMAASVDDLGCVVRMSNARNLLMKRATDPASTPEAKAKSISSTYAVDRALAYYQGRLSMGANDPYRGRRGEAIFNAMKAAPRDKTAGEVLACLTNADAQLKALQDALKP